MAELKALEGDYNSLKQKLDASKARNKVLANENKSFKAEMQKLVDKGTHDDELISALIVSVSFIPLCNNFGFLCSGKSNKSP